MTASRTIEITPELSIPADELRFQFAHSGGPGGQHVNTSATSVELRFDVAASPSLSEAQRARVMSVLKGFIDSRGVLHLVATTSRSQHQNRAEVVARFQRLMRRAL
ncbi:MAG TPA: aminoacyl-tRNA hydrolase, partial [Chloroflexi bacterium]|nr:aminoacyl-tRNA hydrolase [Chloroflexota bacterium]